MKYKKRSLKKRSRKRSRSIKKDGARSTSLLSILSENRKNPEEIVFQIVKDAIDNGANVNERDVRSLVTPLFTASQMFPNVAILLIKNGADVNIPNSKNTTPLMNAVENSYFDVVIFLLENGADPNAVHERGKTALSYCTQDINMTKLLLEHGADPNIGFGPLLESCDNKKKLASIENIEFLLENGGADPNIKKVDFRVYNRPADLYRNFNGIVGDTPLHLIMSHYNSCTENIKRNRIEIAKLLIQYGADIEAKNNENKTPAMLNPAIFNEIYDYIYDSLNLDNVEEFLHYNRETDYIEEPGLFQRISDFKYPRRHHRR